MYNLGKATTFVKMLHKEYKDHVVINMETAASLLGLSNGFPYPITAEYMGNQRILNSTYVEFVKVDAVNRDNVVEIDGVWCTNEERTVCDLIKYDGEYQTMIESLSHYVNTKGKTEELIELAREYGIEEQLDRYMIESEEYYEG